MMWQNDLVVQVLAQKPNVRGEIPWSVDDNKKYALQIVFLVQSAETAH